jgi:hypothetical protein
MSYHDARPVSWLAHWGACTSLRYGTVAGHSGAFAGLVPRCVVPPARDNRCVMRPVGGSEKKIEKQKRFENSPFSGNVFAPNVFAHGLHF